MGDRGNIYIKGADVYLYSHWTGSDLGAVAAKALARHPGRWADDQYLARIVFCEMVSKDDWHGETGFGISHTIGDNGGPIIVLDPETKTASVTLGTYREQDIAKLGRAIPFAELSKMTAKQAREWHLGKEDAS
jgi:hypothetical protein